jgi:hypothetical protein
MTHPYSLVKITVKPTRHRSIAADTDNTNCANRESYLIQSVELVRDLFRKAGAEIPPVRVSTGFTGSRTRKSIGSCWKKEASKDGTFQIFVSPVIGDTIEALATLVHELCHACTGCDGHGKNFKRLALALGLDGKMTATHAGKGLADRLNALVVAKLGNYPHAALNTDPEKTGQKKEGTRLIKCTCEKSGYTVRTTRHWLTLHGPPLSPVTKKPMRVEGVDDIKTEGDEK